MYNQIGGNLMKLDKSLIFSKKIIKIVKVITLINIFVALTFTVFPLNGDFFVSFVSGAIFLVVGVSFFFLVAFYTLIILFYLYFIILFLVSHLFCLLSLINVQEVKEP